MPETNAVPIEELQRDLDTLAARGIAADRQRVKEDMTLQFKDEREWIREYVTNASDAHASRVWIEGWRPDDEHLTISVQDDGHGMDEQGVIDFLTIYRSRKKGGRAIGTHGIGKLSVAAVKSQCGFLMLTSTGSETWRVELGRLLDDAPIRPKEISPVRPRGTRFEITFESNTPLDDELRELRKILSRYVRFLALEVLISAPRDEGPWPLVAVNEDWSTSAGRRGRSYRFSLRNRRYEATLGLGVGGHEVFQNRVLIGSQYNLLSADLKRKLVVPHLRIRLDSPDFELPFGRHALRNDDVLEPVSEHLRRKILPDYFQDLREAYGDHALEGGGAILPEIEAIAAALLRHDDSSHAPWSQIPLFVDVFRHRHSLRALRRAVKRAGAIYLQSEDAAGVDYSVFSVPVMAHRQCPGALEVLESAFSDKLINLGLKDMVLEAPHGVCPALGEQERRFARQLRFHPRAVMENLERTRERRDRKRLMAGDSPRGASRTPPSPKICEEAQDAMADLEKIRWRVGYLVGPDGKTPAREHLFLFREPEVVVNLHHLEVRKLLLISERAPALAGHLAIAMVIHDPNRQVLRHLSAEAVEDLLQADQIAKLGRRELPGLDAPEEELDAASYFARNQAEAWRR